MYAKYQWLSSATEAQIRSDLIALVTGTTDIATLSASCDKVNSAIITNTVPAGWTVHDAISSATSQVVTAPNLDGTTAKYVQINETAGLLTFIGWESWNATTHAGTNQSAAFSAVMTSGTQGGAVAIAPATPNAVYILATARRLCITQGPGWGTAISAHAAEFSRDTAATDITFPVTAIFATNIGNVSSFLDHQYNTNPGATLGVCRIKNPITAGSLTGAGINYTFPLLVRPPLVTIYSTFAAPTLSAAGTSYLTAFPLIICASNGGNNFFILGKIQGGALFFPSSMPTFAHLDEIVIGATTYVLIKVVAANSTASGMAIAYPKE